MIAALVNGDPFTLVAERIEQALKDHLPTAKLVSHWTTFTDEPPMHPHTQAELPALTIAQADFSMNPRATTSSAYAQQTYRLSYESDDPRVDRATNKFKWALLGALHKMSSSSEWYSDLPFVKKVAVRTASDKPDASPDQEPQWVTEIDIVVDMYFNQDELP